MAQKKKRRRRERDCKPGAAPEDAASLPFTCAHKLCLLLILALPLAALVHLTPRHSFWQLADSAAPAPTGVPLDAGAAPPTPHPAPYARQCSGNDFSSGMPRLSTYAPAAPCASLLLLEASLSGATRQPPAVPWEQRQDGDGVDDGELTLGGPCQLHWHSPAEACALLAAMGGLVLVGDSLVRHTELAVRQVVSGNWSVGAYLGGDLPADGIDRWSACQCDKGYGKFWACHSLPSDEAPQRFRALCPAWPVPSEAPPGPLQRAPLQYLAYWGGGWQDGVVRELLQAFRGEPSAPGWRPALLLVEIGPAWDTSWVPGDGGILAELEAAAAAARDGQARLVCMLTLAPDDARKPAYVMPRQNDNATRAINAFVRAHCQGVVLDAYALTKGAWTRDGTHYEGKVMTMIAQALLTIAAMPP